MRRTALHWACQQGDVKCVEALVAAGADTTVCGARSHMHCAMPIEESLLSKNVPQCKSGVACAWVRRRRARAGRSWCRGSDVGSCCRAIRPASTRHRTYAATALSGALTATIAMTWANLKCCVSEHVPRGSHDVGAPQKYRLALTRPEWSPGVNGEFPAPFRAVVRLLVLAAGKRTALQHADQQEAWPLTLDVTCSIFAMAAYPISSWLSVGHAHAASG